MSADKGDNVRYMEVRRRLMACDDPIETERVIAELKAEKGLSLAVLRKCAKTYEREKLERKREQQKAGTNKATEHSEQDPLAAIQEINAGHAVVQYGSRVLILCETYDPVLNRNSLAFLSAHDFRLKFANRSVLVPRGDKIGSAPWGEYWLAHPSRRQYEGIVFAPSNHVPSGYYNLWKGFSVTPTPGSCELLKHHMLSVICKGNTAKNDYLWKWCAHAVQFPHDLPGTAVVMRSAQGAGKNTLVDSLGKIFGRHYLPLTHSGMLVGRFNAHLADAILVFANESVWGGDKASEGRLKAMVTDPIETIEAKGKDPIIVPNFKRLIIASNESWAVPRGIGDRRFFCLDVSDARVGDKDYFVALYKEIEDGGVEAFLDELLKTDITGWHPRHSMPADNVDGEDIKVHSLNSVHKFWLHCLTEGTNQSAAEDGLDAWGTEVNKSTLYVKYLEYCDAQRIGPRMHLNQFGKELKLAVNFDTSRPWGGGTDRGRSYLFPSLDDARKQFNEKIAMVAFDD